MKKNLILLFSSIIIALFLSELLIRELNLAPPTINYIGSFRLVDNPKIMYEMIPGTLVDGSIINKQGFKNIRDFVIKKPNNLVRIAMLGDSITQGLGVPAEATFSTQLEDMLNGEGISKKSSLRYEVMNFGVSGYNLEAEVETLEVKALQYSPDIVILNLFHNDNDPIPGFQCFFNDSNDVKIKVYLMRRYLYNHNSPIEVFIRKLFSHSRLYLLLRERISNSIVYINRIPTLESKCNGSDWGMESIYSGLQRIEYLRALHHFKFLICLHPHLDFNEHPNNKKFADIAGSLQIPYFHMVEYYKRYGIGYDAIRRKDDVKDLCHPNEFGHKIIAEAISKELKKNRFIF